MTSPPLRGVFVTGTDTGIGKTVVSAAIVQHLRARGLPTRYWKPIQTGIEADDDTATVAWLSGCGPQGVLERGVRLPRPLSPHLSARLAGASIDVDDLLRAVDGQPADTAWVVEGAGGALVPVNDRALMVDLMVRLALPVVVVSRTALGTINHTLLTLEALRSRRLTVAGVLMVGEPNPENGDAIECYGRVRVLGTLPMLMPLTPGTLQAATASLAGLDALVPGDPA